MRVHICAVGRIRQGPEAELIRDYQTRFDRTGRALGLGPLTLHEIQDRKASGMAAEASLLRKALPDGAVCVAMDERGKAMTSPAVAQRLAAWRDDGRGDLALIIGGADGIDPGLRAECDMALSLGGMVWPHKLVRVMLCEQLYRAATILAGTPYHRD